MTSVIILRQLSLNVLVCLALFVSVSGCAVARSQSREIVARFESSGRAADVYAADEHWSEFDSYLSDVTVGEMQSCSRREFLCSQANPLISVDVNAFAKSSPYAYMGQLYQPVCTEKRGNNCVAGVVLVFGQEIFAFFSYRVGYGVDTYAISHREGSSADDESELPIVFKLVDGLPLLSPDWSE